MFLVGLTGGIATGKSVVASMLRNMGVEIIDADLVAREVVEPGKRAWKKIRKEFGGSVFYGNGELNRKALGQVVFSDSKKRKCLNSIVHPEIYKSIFQKCISLFFNGHKFVVVDLPLLFESGKMAKYLNKTIVVVCDSDQQLQRLMLRDKLSENDSMARINAQMPLEEKIKLADYVIHNNYDMFKTKEQTEEILKQLRSSKAYWKLRIVIISSIIISVSIAGFGIFKLFQYCQ